MIGVAAVMDSGMDSMTEADVVAEFGELPVHGQ